MLWFELLAYNLYLKPLFLNRNKALKVIPEFCLKDEGQ